MIARASVVMPVRDGERFLATALDSVLNQTVRDIEIVVVDDGSSDDTPTILADYARRDARMRVITTEAAGVACAANRGLEAADAGIVIRMDSDDVMLPDRIERQLDYLDAHPTIVVVGAGMETIDERGRRVGVVSNVLSPAEVRETLKVVNPIAQPTVAMRRAVVLGVGAYRLLDKAEDYDLWLRLAEQYDLAVAPDIVMRYRIRRGQLSHSQAIGALAVRAAAAERARGRTDPLDGVRQITESHVTAMGVRAADVREAVDAERIEWAVRLRLMGDREGANQLVDSPGGFRAAPEIGAAVLLREAKARIRNVTAPGSGTLLVDLLRTNPRAVARAIRARNRHARGAVQRRDAGQLEGGVANASTGGRPLVIVFSFDRAMQLDALLRSYMSHVDNAPKVNVIFRASSRRHARAYAEVRQRFPEHRFVRQRRAREFRRLLLAEVSQSTATTMMFLVDDDVFVNGVDLNVLSRYASERYVPSLRLGMHLRRCYTIDCEQPLPPLVRAEGGIEGLMTWRWSNGVHDWGYPLSLDGHVFLRAEMVEFMKELEFEAPNSFEAALQQHQERFGERRGVCYSTAPLVNVPWNRVQSESENRCGSIHQDVLLEQWERGLELDVERLTGLRSVSCHQELEPTFRPRTNAGRSH